MRPYENLIIYLIRRNNTGGRRGASELIKRRRVDAAGAF